MAAAQFVFAAGSVGVWRIDRIESCIGPSLPEAPRLQVSTASEGDAVWTLRGVVSNLRYTTRSEADALTDIQAGLGRTEATRAVLIPIRKSDAWWALAQDERRAIYEEKSRHTTIGLEYLPAIVRRLHHSRDLGEPFDFLTWFEFAPAHETEFRHLLARLRAQEEWRYVDREVELWLTRD